MTDDTLRLLSEAGGVTLLALALIVLGLGLLGLARTLGNTLGALLDVLREAREQTLLTRAALERIDQTEAAQYALLRALAAQVTRTERRVLQALARARPADTPAAPDKASG